MRCHALFCFILLLSSSAWAQTVTWTGIGGTGSWSDPMNWDVAAPVDGDDLVFPSGVMIVTTNNDISLTTINSIQFTSTAGTDYTISGNGFELTAGVTSTGGNNTIDIPLILSAMPALHPFNVTVDTLEITQSIDGVSGLIKTGAGTLRFTAPNLYTGDTDLSGGTILLGSPLPLDPTGMLTLRDGTAFGTVFGGFSLLGNSTTIIGDITLTAAFGNLVFVGPINLGATNHEITLFEDSIVTAAEEISGTGGITLLASDPSFFPIFEMPGFSNTYTGLTRVGNGVDFYIHKDPGEVAILGALQIDLNALCIVDDNGSVQQIAPTSTVTVNGELLYGGFAGDFGQTFEVLNGTGLVTNGNPGGGFKLQLTVRSGTFSGSIGEDIGAGAVSLVKDGPGILSLGGVNTFVGSTTVSAGVLVLTGSLATTSSVSVAGGATLAGTGTIASAVTTQPGGIFSPGVAGIGTLIINGAVTWNGSTDGRATALYDLSASNTTSDRLTVGGALNKGSGTVYGFDFQGVAGSGDYVLATFASTTFAVADFSAINLPAGLEATFTLTASQLSVHINASPIIASVGFTPALPVVGEPVNFTVAASDPEGVPLTISFDYGDGTTGTSSSHVYTLVGSYTVTITVSDGSLSATAMLQVTVGPDSTPFRAKLQLSIGPAGAGQDRVHLKGRIFIEAGGTLSGKMLVLDIGGNVESFVLNEKGKAQSANGAKFAFKLTKKVQLNGGDCSFKMSIKNANYSAKLKALTPLGTLGLPDRIPVTVMLDAKARSISLPMTYRARGEFIFGKN